MRVEIKNASNFLTNLLRLKCKQDCNPAGLEAFGSKLEKMLGEHYQQHWFPDSPFKGSGYRCIRINHKMDPILARAGSESGFDEESLKNLFPHELTLWIDPREVSYRIGENGSICVLYDGSNGSVSPKPPKNKNILQRGPKPGNKSPTPRFSERSTSPNNNTISTKFVNRNTWTITPPKTVANRQNSYGGSDQSDEDYVNSPMSMSPPSPVMRRAPTCKESFRETGFIMDPRNISFELSTYVSS